MKRFFRLFSIVVPLFILGGVIFALLNTRAILDWYALRDYSPPSRIISIADATTMKDNTRNVFYVNHPELQNKKDFTNSCTRREETIVLGCYVQPQGIYLLDVTDARLQGVIEVTAAHEVLHAMYDRLDNTERENVDKMTAAFFAKLENERIKTNVENYRIGDASVVPNELHSILATEVRDLSPELEAYYSRYFTNRKAIIDFSEKYEQTFTDLENQVKAYDQQLKAMKDEIDASEKQIEALGGSIDTEKKRLDDLLSSGREEEYNALVPEFNRLVNRYNSLLRERQVQVNEYNRIIELRNSLATTESELINSLKAGQEEIPDKATN